jgi:MFS family permease
MNSAGQKRFVGMKGFTIIWVGQLFSLLGTSMVTFSLTIWAWQLTGKATTLALVAFFNFVPFLLTTPVAGAIIDRSNRKNVMIRADLAAGLPTVGMLLLNATGNMQIWHVYIATAIAGVFQAFHFPAYSAAVTMMLPKEQYGRASGMLSAAEFASGIFAPVAAAIMMNIVGLAGVMIIDVITFVFAISLLMLIHIPQPLVTDEKRDEARSIRKQLFFGFNYIFKRPSLLGLQLVLFSSNLLSSFGNTVVSPMILARTNNDSILLGSVMSAAGIGGVVGGAVLSIWGGPKRKIHGVLLGNILMNLLGWFLVGLGQNWYVWALAAFLGIFFLPILNGSNQAIWQVKVPPTMQGRVFAARLFIAQMGMPLGMLIAGPLADSFFEPSMMSQSSLAAIFGNLVGTGPGSGMSLMLILAGLLGSIAGLGAYGFRALRDAEDILSDYGRSQ